MRLESNHHPTALLITGTVGAGKTSVAAAAASILAEARILHAVIDLDALSQSWPTPPDDPFNLAMELRNLDSLARNYLSAGACRLVVSGVRAPRRSTSNISSQDARNRKPASRHHTKVGDLLLQAPQQAKPARVLPQYDEGSHSTSLDSQRFTAEQTPPVNRR